MAVLLVRRTVDSLVVQMVAQKVVQMDRMMAVQWADSLALQ
jgi:hypothetical protein